MVGRPKLAESQRLSERVEIRLTAEHATTLRELGGAQWVREKIAEEIELAAKVSVHNAELQREYVYTHAKPDGSVFYVGRGRGNRSSNFYNRSPDHRALLLSLGKENVRVTRIDCSEGDSKRVERELIRAHLDGGAILLNTKISVDGRRYF